MSRHDGRSDTQLRTLSASLGDLDRADGSAQFGFGSSSALASVSGPIEVRLREELPDKVTLEVSHRPLEGVGATPSRALITTLHSVFPPLLNLGAHPRSLVQLVVQSLSPTPLPVPSSITQTEQKSWPPETYPPTVPHAPISGTFFTARAAAINAASLALLDLAAVGLRGVPVSVALAYLPNDRLVIDPSNEEERQAISRHVFAWAFGSGLATKSDPKEESMEVDDSGEAEIALLESEGDFSRQDVDAALTQGRVAASDILSFMRQQLATHLSKRL